MRRKNQGFTLLELIVTISIMAIFSGVVLTVIGTAAHSYRSTSGSAKVQMEAQNIMDQIQDMIIDVNRSVYYAYGNGIDSNTTDPISNDIDSDAGAMIQDKTFYACTGKEDKDASADPAGKTYDYICNLVQWDSNSQKLYYARSTWKGIETEKKNTTGASENQEESKTPSENGNGDAATGKSEDDAPINLTDMDMEPANAQSDDNSDVTVVTTPVSQRTTTEKTLLAENVTDFRVDVSKAVSERIVRFRFTVRLNGKETTTVHTVNLRNQIQVSKPFEGYSSTTEKAAITILRYPETVEAGKTVKGFSSYKKGNIDPSTVRWMVESENATFNGGNGGDDASVTLQANEGLQDGIAITVHVEAKTSDGQTVQSNPVTITVKDVVPQSLECTTDKILLGVGGNSYDLKSLGWKVKYSDGSSKDLSEDELNKIQWTTATSIEGVTVAADNANVGTITTTKGTAGPGTTADNSKFTVTASYTTESGNVAFSKTIQVILVRLDIMSSKETFTVGDDKNLTYSYKVDGVEQSSANNRISNSNNNIGNIQFAYTFNTDNNQTTNGTSGNPKTMSTGDAFVADDVGSWTVTATLDMSTVNGVNGTISAACRFNVKQETNVYDCEAGGNGTAFAYVPIDETSIKAVSHLISDKQDSYYKGGENGEGYTYYYEYTAPGTTELYKAQIRYSIDPRTGIGKNGDSQNKWFMRMRKEGEEQWIYYRLENDGNWYKFHNKQDKNENTNKSEKTDFYWNIKHAITINNEEIQNSQFWKQW